MVYFSSNRKGYGFGPMPGFNKKRKGTICRGNFDRDKKPNRKDCDALNWKKQDNGEVIGSDATSELNRRLRRGYAPGEKELIEERLERARLKKKMEAKK